MAFIRQHMMGMAGDPVFASKRRSAGAGTKAKAARHRAVRFRRMMGDPFGGMVGAGAGSFAAPGKASFNFMSALGKFAGGIKGMASKAAPLVKGALGSGVLGPAGVFASNLMGGSTVSPGAMASLQRRGAAGAGFGPMPGAPAFVDQLGGGAFGGGGATNKDGSPRRIRADGRPYKRPTLNALNPKALARAGRRFQGFKKAIRAVNASLPSGMKFEAPGAPKSTRRRKR